MSIREKIVGTWQLLEFAVEANGKTIWPMGKDAKGFLSYASDGYVSANLMCQPPLEHGLEPEEALSGPATKYMAYAGRFEVVEAQQAIIHNMEVSLFPEWLGDAQYRYVKFEDDRLIISANQEGGATAILAWKKASPNC